jgi:hypothetical protein
VKLPVEKLNNDIEEIKRSYHDLAAIIAEQKSQRAKKDFDLEKTVKDLSLEFERMKT